MGGGIALGISRYRLFDLETWWFRAVRRSEVTLGTTLVDATKSWLDPPEFTPSPSIQYLPAKVTFVFVVALRMPMKRSWLPGKTAMNTLAVADT